MAYLRAHDETPILLPPARDAGVIYTCPIHPRIRQVGPGNCPVCGMTLEPVEVTPEVGASHELAYMTRRFWIGLVNLAGVSPGDGRSYPGARPA